MADDLFETLANGTPEQVADAVDDGYRRDFEKEVTRQIFIGDTKEEAKRRRTATARAALAGSFPKGHTLTERLALPRPKVSFRIEGWQGTGHRVILAAQFKAGKTTLVANLVRSLLDGTPFLDRYHTYPVSRVSLLDFEMGTPDANQLDDWYRKIGIVHTDALRIFGLRGQASAFNILDDDVRRQWADVLRGDEYLIVDCLRPILDAIGLDENHETGRFLVALDALLREANIPEALLVHHMGHQNERSRGDSRLQDWPGALWTLVRETEDPASPRFIKAFGRDVDVPETALLFNPKNGRMAIGQGSRRIAQNRGLVDALLDFVEHESTPPIQKAIRDALKSQGFTDKPIRSAIQDALKLGYLKEDDGPKTNTKVYSVTSRPTW